MTITELSISAPCRQRIHNKNLTNTPTGVGINEANTVQIETNGDGLLGLMMRELVSETILAVLI